MNVLLKRNMMHFLSFVYTFSISVVYGIGSYSFWMDENQNISGFGFVLLFHIFIKFNITAISFL